LREKRERERVKDRNREKGGGEKRAIVILRSRKN